MKKKTIINEKHRSRKKFLKSMGMAMAGLSLVKPSIFNSYLRDDIDIKYSSHSENATLFQQDNLLPEGVRAVWDINKAWHETTTTRERICINGLWQWQPAEQESDEVPVDLWGYFKVPGNWPGEVNYMQRDNQKVYPNPHWKDKKFDPLSTAWYRREISIPEGWKGRNVILSMEYVNSSARIYIDNRFAGEILFPAGEINLTTLCKPGEKYSLAVMVTALPLQDVVAVFNDSNAPRQGKGIVSRPGLCGDVYLAGLPSKGMISDVRVYTSYRKEELRLEVALKNIDPGLKYKLVSVITHKGIKVAEFNGKLFTKNDLSDGLISATQHWIPDNLWDIHTPDNLHEISVSVFTSDDKLVDTTFKTIFGFREFWIEGRDFYLNGTRIYLSAVPYDNAQIGAAFANYEGARESFRRLKSFGINFVYSHNYGCEPGTHISFAEILNAADDEGMLFSLSQPHFGQYDWIEEDADVKNGYAHHARFYTTVAKNHPSVVFYSMSHNATGYTDDMNPDLIDGINRTDSQWSQNNVRKALRAEAIVKKIDPSRIVYHHSSGNLSPMHTSNFYPNWVPIQEMNDWFQHWSTEGVKPLMLCEFGAPFTWDWAIYRGWYKGKREFGSALVPWEFCLAEWNAQFLGDKAYMISDKEKENLRWEAGKFREGAVWSRSSYPYNFDSRELEERNPVFAMHIKSNWRSFRTWGVSINSPWHHSPYFRLKAGIKKERKDFKVDWDKLQRPGFNPDFIADRSNRMDLDIYCDRSDWIPNEAGEALIKNNMPLLAFIGGKPSAFTSQDHNFLQGSTFEKQLIVLNNSREIVSCSCTWKLNLPDPLKGSQDFELETGQKKCIVLKLSIPSNLTPGDYELTASFKFSNNELQNDLFKIHVLPSTSMTKLNAAIALFDPKGHTGRLMDRMGIYYRLVNPGDDLSGIDILVIGREALTTKNEGLNLESVRKGLKVIMFEQTSEVLEKRFGFRVQEYGLRQLYIRVPDHPVMEGLTSENLADWHGDSTIVAPRIKFESDRTLFNGVQTVKWCDMPVTRIWRCGNRGNVSTVLIEKPTSGNFLPLIDGGYSLQYSPLIEYREGAGMVVICQMDVTARSESDPASEKLAWNIMKYVSEWQPEIVQKKVLYAGNDEGQAHLHKTGISFDPINSRGKNQGDILILGPGSKQKISTESKVISKFLKKGGKILSIGLDQADSDSLLPTSVTFREEEHIAAWFEPFSNNSVFAGISPADVHYRAPVKMPKVSSGAEVFGNGILAQSGDGNIIFCQLVPWQLDYSREQHNVKQTYRRTSFMLSRLLGNIGAISIPPFIERFNSPLVEGKEEKRWLQGLYVDIPEEWDDPYRFFRW